MPSEIIKCMGHPNVRAKHKSTLEFTMDEDLSVRGDCIFAVCAQKSTKNLSLDIRKSLKKSSARLKMTIECARSKDTVNAFGHPGLELTHPWEAVIRKSHFICPRTLAVGSDKAACDLDRALIRELAKGKPAVISLEVF